MGKGTTFCFSNYFCFLSYALLLLLKTFYNDEAYWKIANWLGSALYSKNPFTALMTLLLYHDTLLPLQHWTASMECSECKRPVCKKCTKDFPFSSSACLECAESIKTGLGGIRKDEEIF